MKGAAHERRDVHDRPGRAGHTEAAMKGDVTSLAMDFPELPDRGRTPKPR